MYEISLKITFFAIFFSCFVARTDSTTKTWTHNVDVFDKKNWLENTDENCHGIHFAETNAAQIFLTQNNIETTEIVLPENGQIALNTTITFTPSSKCIRLKPLNNHLWEEYHSWTAQDNNPAIPHLDRLPCFYDDVDFPAGIHSGIQVTFSDEVIIPYKRVRSFKYGGEYYMPTTTALVLLQPDSDNSGMRHLSLADAKRISDSSETCSDPKGCLCQTDDPVYCLTSGDDEIDNCLDPIQPLGFCGRICGAYILFRPLEGFDLRGIQKKLSKYEVYTYAGKSLITSTSSEDVIQVVFREQNYTGKCVDYAREFYTELLANTKSYSIEQLELYTSGPYYIENGSVRVSLTIVFGTFLGVVGIFAVFYYVYYDTSRYQSKRYFMARFDNTDEGGELIIEEKSLAGSVLSLDKSFDNPMYGQTPSSTSTSVDTMNIVEESSKSSKSEGTLNENPLYDIELNKTIKEVAED